MAIDACTACFVFRQTYWWHDKFRPRKPRYFNRVKTGYDWNKYNQTHYDHDNPPPKTVQVRRASDRYMCVSHPAEPAPLELMA